MCYHSLYICTECGHGTFSAAPIKTAPMCPMKEQIALKTPILTSPLSPFSPLSPTQPKTLRSPTSGPQASDQKDNGTRTACGKKDWHPLHTFRIQGLCGACWKEKEGRLAHFDVVAIQEGVNREYIARRRKNKVAVEGKRLRPLRTGYQEGKRQSLDETTTAGNHEQGHARSLSDNMNVGVGKAVEGFKGILGWETPTKGVSSGTNSPRPMLLGRLAIGGSPTKSDFPTEDEVIRMV